MENVIKISNLITVLLIIQVVSAYEFCDPTFVAYSFRTNGDITDIINANTEIESSGDLNYYYLSLTQNMTRTRCEEILQTENGRQWLISHGVDIDSVRCDLGHILLNDSTIITFNDYYVSAETRETGCINDTKFPYPTTHNELLNKANLIGNYFGLGSGWDYLFVTKVSNNPFSEDLGNMTGYITPLSNEEDIIPSDFFDRGFGIASVYFSHTRDANAVWILQTLDSDRIVVLGDGGPYTDVLFMKVEINLNKIALQELKGMEISLQNISMEIMELKKEYTTANKSKLESQLNKLNGNNPVLEKIRDERQILYEIKKQQALQSALFESEEFPEGFRDFMYPKINSYQIIANNEIELLDKELDNAELRAQSLEQNIQTRIQLLESQESTEKTINQQWIVIGIVLIATIGMGVLGNLFEIINKKRPLFCKYQELQKLKESKIKKSKQQIITKEIRDIDKKLRSIAIDHNSIPVPKWVVGLSALMFILAFLTVIAGWTILDGSLTSTIIFICLISVVVVFLYLIITINTETARMKIQLD